MTIDKALEAKILRFHHVEGWGVHTIAVQLGVHHSTVDRVLSLAGLPKIERAARPSILDPYLPFMVQMLEQYPKLSAVRLLEMARIRGYQGGSSHFRARVSQLRPRKLPEAYLRLTLLQGEVAQCDWGHFGQVEIGRAKRPLMAFVMVLGYSRRVFLRFYLNARTDNFIRGHVDAFNSWGACPRVCWYDNLKSAVLERDGTAIRYNPRLLELAAHYHFEPRAMNVYRGNEKGRVERAIRFIRGNFFAARTWTSLEELNAQADLWCAGTSDDRAWPQDNTITIREAFAQEQPSLLSLPENPFLTEERLEVRVPKTPYIRFDLNDYSVPPAHVRTTLTVMASQEMVRILDGSSEVARHRRCWDKGQQVEDEAHIAALVDAKRAARKERGQNRLSVAVPSSALLLKEAGERGYSLRSLVRALQRLLDEYGASELELACVEALERGVPHDNAVRQSLERRREEHQLPPALALALPDNEQARNLSVRPHTLAAYDQINQPRPTTTYTTQETSLHDTTTDNDNTGS
jgi:transposase